MMLLGRVFAGRRRILRGDAGRQREAEGATRRRWVVEALGWLALPMAGRASSDASAEPEPAPIIWSQLIEGGWLVDVGIAPPGVEAPRAEPGRGRSVFEMDRGYRMAYISRGPEAGHRKKLDEVARRVFNRSIWDWDRDEAERFQEVEPGEAVEPYVPRWERPEVLALGQPWPTDVGAWEEDVPDGRHEDGSPRIEHRVEIMRTWETEEVAGCRLCLVCRAKPPERSIWGKPHCTVRLPEGTPKPSGEEARLWSERSNGPLPAEEGGPL